MYCMRKRRSDYIDIDKDLLLKTYTENNKNLTKTSKVINISEKTIKRRLIDYNLGFKKRTQYNCDHNCFDELNEESLYWLGFLSADGISFKRKYSCGIKLLLSSKDRDHIEKFKKFTKSTAPIKDYSNLASINKNPEKEYFTSQITIVSKKIFNRLVQLNIVPNKTFIYSIPNEIKNHELVRHFIRGAIDGDGWIRLHKNNNKKYFTNFRVGLCGASSIVLEVKELLIKNCALNKNSGFFCKNINTYKLEFDCNDAFKILDYLYKDATLYLDRKNNIARGIEYKKIIERKRLIKENKKQLEIDKINSIHKTHEEFDKLYFEIGSVEKISKLLGVKKSSIDYYIKYNNLITRKYRTIDYSIFDQDNEISYYWGGFLAGKSTLIIKNNIVQKIFLSSYDKSDLDLFKSTTGINCSIHNMAKNGYIIYLCNQNELTKIVNKFGIIKDKRNKYIIPENILKNINLRHFLRGYIDAYSTIINKHKLVFMINNSLEFLQKFHELISINCGFNFDPNIIKKTNNYIISYYGYKVKSIFNYLYGNSNISLLHKYNKVFNYI